MFLLILQHVSAYENQNIKNSLKITGCNIQENSVYQIGARGSEKGWTNILTGRLYLRIHTIIFKQEHSH